MSILNTRVPGNPQNAQTIGGVLAEILCALVDEGESFSGKRPLGNSGWMEHLLYEPMQAAGLVSGPDSDKEADRLLKSAIREALTNPRSREKPTSRLPWGDDLGASSR